MADALRCDEGAHAPGSMSVRAPPMFVHRPNRLREVLTAAQQRHAHATADGIEYDVLDSGGLRFGSAVVTMSSGAVFVTPTELQGVLVRPPFRVTQQPNSQRLASTLAEVLSSALGR